MPSEARQGHVVGTCWHGGPQLPYATPDVRSLSAHLPPPRDPAHVQRSRPPCTAKPGKSPHPRSSHTRNLVSADSLNILSSRPHLLIGPSHSIHWALLPRPETSRNNTTMDGAVRPALGARTSSVHSVSHSLYSIWSEGKMSPRWRHTLGITLLLVTVLLWTASNFLASVSCSRLFFLFAVP